jgi:hypothetical protein
MKNRLLMTSAFMSFALLSACNFDEHETTGPTETVPVSIEAGSSDHANVELNMGFGEMTVTGGATKLVQGNLEYNVARMKPEVTSSSNGDHATVTVRQPGGSNTFGKTRNVWDLQLSNKVLLDLTVNCGAGQAKLDLGDALLRELEVHMGAGQVDLDLTGKPKHDYEVTIHGGVGQATVHLPEGVGVFATAHGGIGSINVTGLDKQGDHWQNDLYDKAKVNVKVDVEGGIGEIRLIG